MTGTLDRARRLTSNATTPSEKRRRWVTVVVAMLIIGVGATGLLVGARLRSPAEQALETAPPELGPLTAPVEFGRLGEEVIERGVWVEVNEDSIGLPGIAGQGRIITAIAEPGVTVHAGDAPLELEGRPLFVLEGTEALYRDLTGGTKGRDVEAIQLALVAVGLDPGPIDGVYGPGTAAAVSQLYARAGYEPPSPPVNDAQLRDAGNLVADSEATLRAAEQERSSTIAELRTAVTSAERTVDDARASLEDAKVLADERIQSAIAETTAAQLAYDEAVKALEEAPPEERQAAEQKVAEALARLEEAEATEASVRAAVNEIIRQAESGLATAQQSLDTAKRNESDTEGLDAAVDSAQRALTQARQSLETTRLEGLTPFPVVEIRLVPRLPARTADAPADTGELVEGDAIVLTREASLVAVAVVPRDVARRAEQGLEAIIRSEGLADIAGSVSWIAPQVGPAPGEERYGIDMSVPDGQVAVEVVPSSNVDASAGAPLTVTLDFNITDDQTLIVPLAAIRTDGDGTSWVAVASDDGATRRVVIEVNAVSDGRASVSGEDLHEGDEVVLGGE